MIYGYEHDATIKSALKLRKTCEEAMDMGSLKVAMELIAEDVDSELNEVEQERKDKGDIDEPGNGSAGGSSGSAGVTE